MGLKSYLRESREPAKIVAPLMEKDKAWSVYIVRCQDASLYTGIAKDVGARVACHNEGTGAAYTRSRRPVNLEYRRDGMTLSEALVLEARIKSLPRSEKERLLRGSDAK